MGDPRSAARRGFGIRLTADEDELIHRETARTDAPSFSSVFEAALVAFLRDHEESGSGVLAVPTARGLRNRQLVARQFQVDPSTLARLRALTERHGWTKQAVARAAMLRLAETVAVPDRGAGAGVR